MAGNRNRLIVHGNPDVIAVFHELLDNHLEWLSGIERMERLPRVQ